MISNDSTSSISTLDAVVIGSGFAGLCMGIRLKQAGIDNFIICEKESRVGGTWRDNHYPGSACDVPSFLYSYSFEQKKDWSFRYAEQAEILEYLEHCASKYGLYAHIKFKTEIAQAVFQETDGQWQVITSQGQIFYTKFLVSACGQLHHPSIPAIEGLNQFAGTQFHSARWDHQCDLQGKTVAVVGNAASAVQFVPPVAEKAAKTYIFQRSPQWVATKGNNNFSSVEQWLNHHFPWAPALRRFWIYWTLEMRFRVFLQGTLSGKLFQQRLTQKILSRLKKVNLDDSLLPEYTVGCKRILLSNDYYEVLARPTVEVISHGIAKVTPKEIITADGKQYPVDVIIFGTGFKSNAFLHPIQLEGVAGKMLSQAWKMGPEAYFGMMVSGFPNFFLLFGPNTGLGHSSIVYMIEKQVDYIVQLLQLIKQKNLKYLDVKSEVMANHNAKLQEDMQRLVWSSSCQSWYKNESGKVINNWPDFTWKYARQVKRIRLEDFNLV